MDIEILRKYSDRFWSKFDEKPEGQCWNWRFSKDQNGYGQMKIGRKPVRTHRIAYALHYGVWPGEFMVCHTCDNPSCCNPAHLWKGTNQDNQNDSVRKGRKNAVSMAGETNPSAKLSKEQAEQAVTLIAQGLTNKRIASMLGVSHAAISLIRLSKAWPDLFRPANNNYFKRYASCRK